MAVVLSIQQRLPRIFLRYLWSLRASSASGDGASVKAYSPGSEDAETYRRTLSAKADYFQRNFNNPRRFQNINDREERSIIPAAVTESMVAAKYLTVYRGIDMLKGPEDMLILFLYQMFWHVRPRTVIELGSFTGASALWMTDALEGADIECNVFSVDIDLSLLHPKIKSLQPPNLSFIEGDCNHIEEIFPSEFLVAQPHPFIVIDDAHVSFDKAMDHFHCHLSPGDYIVCEDTCPYAPATVLGSEGYSTPLGLKKLHSWKRFLN